MVRLFLAIVVLVASCKGREDLDGTRRALPGLSERVAEYTLLPDDRQVVLDLWDNRAAAVVHGEAGLTIECGSADVAKYLEGVYRSRWHISAADGGRRVALINGLAGELYVPIDREDGGVRRFEDGSLKVYITARAAKAKQLVSVFANEKRLGDISMPTTEWKTYSIRAPASTLVDGENKLRLYFRHTGQIDGRKSAAAIQRIVIGTRAPKDKPTMRADTVTRGQNRLMALSVSGPARLSYYLAVPTSRAELIFAAGGDGTALSVRVTGADSSSADLVWQGKATAAWNTTQVDLSDWAGEVVRIDLASAGPVDWGRPQIVIPRRERRAARAQASSKVADHVLVWVVSALRADRIGGEVATPGFQRLAERGMRFTNANSAAPVPAAAHVALLTGKHPQGGTIPASDETLGERFGDAGFTTALISGNGFVNDDAGFAQGFAIYRNPMRRRHPFRARILWQEARRILHKHQDGRTFIYLVTVEPHLPYSPSLESLSTEWERGPMRFTPAETIALRESVLTGKEQLTREEQSYVRALYNAEVRDANAAFGEMLGDIEQMGIAERTAIILVGDHGEEMWERGQFGHGLHLYQEVLHVPLVVALPQTTAATVVERDVSLIDLHATALELAGITAGTENQGTSMLAAYDEALPRPIFAHLPGRGRSLKLGRYKMHVPLRGPHKLYDLDSDAGERDDIMGRRPIVERYMRNVFGIGVAYQPVWSRSRWGTANNMSPAFAADHGL